MIDQKSDVFYALWQGRPVMRGSKSHLERMVWGFLLSVAAACLASGAALATCTPPGTINPGDVPCYMTVQPIDVATTVGSSVAYAPFNSTSPTIDPTTAGSPLQTLPASSPSNLVGVQIPTNSISSNPIGFVVQPASGASPGTLSNPGVDVTRELLNNLGVELVWLPMTQYVYPACPASAPAGS